jgi:predicted GNAT family N-acyltransferase
MSTSEHIKAEELRFEILNERHNLSQFDCSKDDETGLNEFIHDEALQFQKENLGVTYLFFHNNVIVGFATLAMSQIEIKQTKIKPPFETSIRDYPALMIGRLATDNSYRGRHVGLSISLWCVSKAKQLSKEVGCRLIIILTNDKKANFYGNCGFEMIPKYERKTGKWMYLPIP